MLSLCTSQRKSLLLIKHEKHSADQSQEEYAFNPFLVQCRPLRAREMTWSHLGLKPYILNPLRRFPHNGFTGIKNKKRLVLARKARASLVQQRMTLLPVKLCLPRDAFGYLSQRRDGSLLYHISEIRIC